MKVLLTGATGFIGRCIGARLTADGYRLCPAVRNVELAARLFPGAEARRVDFNTATSPEHWRPLLDDVDAVINCVGILQAEPGQSIAAIHTKAPIALFKACEETGVGRVIQISAISARADAGTAYAETKMAADAYLAGTNLDWIVLKPSLIVDRGSFGGTSLLRGLAALPGAIPVAGGWQEFQPLAAEDLAEGVVRALTDSAVSQAILEPAGPEILTLEEILARLRQWLGLRPAPFIRIPKMAARLAARIGDLLGRGPLRSTSLRQMEVGNTGDPARFFALLGRTPATLGEFLEANPASVQDRWHARLYFAGPVLRIVLAVIWLVSGMIGLWQANGIDAVGMPLIVASCLWNLALALWTLSGRAILACAWSQALTVITYSLGTVLILPHLLADPFGPILKNLAVLTLIPIWATLERGK